MRKLVNTDLSAISMGNWLKIMDSADLDNIDDVKDFAKLCAVIWHELLSMQSIPELKTLGFLETHAPVYDNWQMIDDKFCCEKTLLHERERLTELAKKEGF